MPTNNLAPIVIFVYNRQWHTQQTIEALQKNELSDQSDLIIYSDGSKNDQSSSQVQEVRNYLKTVSGFKTIKIIERDKNWGLAANIIDGVSEVINHYGKVIVMEDDIVTSPSYLSFMNQALEHYQNENKVWHISGWNYPLTDGCNTDAFFWRVMNCWGWATWNDRWQHFNKDPKKLIDKWKEEKIHRFNLDGTHDFWSQVLNNQSGKLNTWAIFWYATIFTNNGLCLNPYQSYVKNIGNDGTGENCGKVDIYSKEINSSEIKMWPSRVLEDDDCVKQIKMFFKNSRIGFVSRVIRRIRIRRWLR
ncbi:glycosyltransferase family 2 protein [Vibrio sp. A8-1]|uniref:glycosyltransferase family 2 protein n=1 Tax=Vibrio sp. A8-1 TaxID=2591023 RepID=UPI001482C395|nr:glycosyltransferase [Vibrio sp. A8-1]NNN84135.1 glycosyltransferase family 2 protein [Vibrio sp. A8-1]